MGVEMCSISPLFPATEKKFHSSAQQAGMLVASCVIVYAVLGSTFGILSHRIPRRASILGGTAMLAVGNLACAQEMGIL